VSNERSPSDAQKSAERCESITRHLSKLISPIAIHRSTRYRMLKMTP
jgi:hypothetical protein